MRQLATLIFALCLGLSGGGLAAEPGLERGRAAAEAFLAGDTAAVWEDMTPQMQQSLGSREELENFRDSLTRDFGSEATLLEETAEAGEGGVEIYRRTARWSDSEAPILVQLAIDAEARIAGLLVEPVPVLADSRFLDYQTQARLQLPFAGEWFVVWGGRTLEQNYHAADRAQRFAIDVLVLQDGASHAGDGARLEDYHCWGRPILAPAAGTVARVVGDLPDNPIGETDARHPAGNHVVIDFGNSEFGFLAHLQEGSVQVAEGAALAAGDVLGHCGNSGNTSEPHLHFHLQTTPLLSSGEGLPAFFEHYLADGQRVDRGEPLAGQTISSQ